MTTTYHIVLLLTIILFVECSQSADNITIKQNSNSDTVTTLTVPVLDTIVQSTVENKDCKFFFTFNAVDHYNININQDEIKAKSFIEKKSENDKILLDVLTKDWPLESNNLNVITKIGKVGYTKTSIPTTKLDALRNIFCENKVDNMIVMSCMPIYRDVLVFKNNNRVVGIAKLCFQCDQSVIIGAHAETEYFGQGDEFKRLTKILK